jgi:hypothetical protein
MFAVRVHQREIRLVQLADRLTSGYPAGYPTEVPNPEDSSQQYCRLRTGTTTDCYEISQSAHSCSGLRAADSLHRSSAFATEPLASPRLGEVGGIRVSDFAPSGRRSRLNVLVPYGPTPYRRDWRVRSDQAELVRVAEEEGTWRR